MAILKYTDKNGNIVAVNSYKINNVIVSQTTGQSTADVMSQKAVTDELTTKANSSDVYTKTESDGKFQPKGNYLTSHQSLSDYAKKTEVTSADTALQNDIDANEAAVTAALNKLKQSAGFNANGEYVNSDYTSLSDAIDDLVERLTAMETEEIIDCGVYAE